MKIVIIGFWTFPKKTPRAFRTWNLAEGFAEKGHEVVLYSYTGGKDYAKETKGLFKVKNLGKSQPWCDDSISTAEMPLYMRVINKLIREVNIYPYRKCYPHIESALREEGKIDLLISVAYPHVVHWAVAKYINRQNVKKWIAECGDPFMGDPFTNHKASLEKIERNWCEKVDYITIPIEGGITAYYPEYREKIRVIPQGFKFDNIDVKEYTRNEIPTFGFAGLVYPNLRDPRRFLEYIYEKNIPIRFIVYSTCNVFQEFHKLMPEKIEVRELVDRNRLIKELSSVDFLINIKNLTGVQVPSKLIDYTLMGRPILDISTQFTKTEEQNFLDFLKGDYSNKHEDIDIAQYSIDNVCESFLKLV